MILTLICLLDPPSEFQIQDITRTRNVDNTNWQMDASLLMIKHQDNPALSIWWCHADAVFLTHLIFADNKWRGVWCHAGREHSLLSWLSSCVWFYRGLKICLWGRLDFTEEQFFLESVSNIQWGRNKNMPKVHPEIEKRLQKVNLWHFEQCPACGAQHELP